VSDDGDLVVFESIATNLVAGDTNGRSDIFLRDRDAQTTTLISIDSEGGTADGNSYFAGISRDGNFVVFRSNATDLVDDLDLPPDVFQVYLRDLEGNTTQLVSLNEAGTGGLDGDSASYAISDDGHLVLFTTAVPDSGLIDLVVWDSQDGASQVARIDAVGFSNADISGDGRFVVYDALGEDDDTQVYVYDTLSHLTTVLSVDVNGAMGNASSANPLISPDGRFVSFASYADNLVIGDSNGDIADVFTVDLSTIVWDLPLEASVGTSGDLVFTDANSTDTHTANVGTSPTGYLGDFTVDQVVESNGVGTVGWQFTVDHNDISYLAAGEALRQTYDVTVVDAGGASTTQQVTVTIVGANDAPTVDLDAPAGGTGYETNAVADDTPVALFSDHVSVFDIDSATVHSASVTLQGGGTYTDYPNEDVYVDLSGLTGASGNGHSGSWNGLNWVITNGSSGFFATVTGDASASTYEEVLEALRFSTTSSDHTDHTVQVVLNDGVLDSNIATSIIHVSEPPPPNNAPAISYVPQDNHVLSATSGYVAGRTSAQSVLLSNLGISSDSAVTVEFWMNAGATAGNSMIPFGFYLYDLYVADFGPSHGGMGIGFNAGTGGAIGVNRSDLIGQWHHIAAVFNDGDITQSKLYIDGVQQTLGSLLYGGDAGFDSITNNNAEIAGFGFDNQYSLDGMMDNVAIWHGERTGSQIIADMNGINPDQPTLAALYSFENTSNGAGGVIDSSGNNHDGTLSGLTVASNIATGEIPQLNDRTLYGLSISDPDNPNDQFTVTATALHGTVLPNAGTGTLTEVNEALAAGVTYTPDNTAPSNDTVTLTVTDSQGHEDAMHFVFNVTGTGPITLDGTSGKDVIFATGYDDTLTGNAGADTFVFASEPSGGSHDTVSDFQQGQDMIELDGFFSGPSDSAFTAFLVSLENALDGVHDINLGNNHVITLSGVNVNTLDVGDFIVRS
jgi:VCBS repeat-containing protein